MGRVGTAGAGLGRESGSGIRSRGEGRGYTGSWGRIWSRGARLGVGVGSQAARAVGTRVGPGCSVMAPPLPPARLAAMPLHKFPVGLWKQLRLREGICSRLPPHYLRSLEEARTPTPVHYRPHGVKFKTNPKNGQRERVEDVPIPIYYPPESQLGLWGGEGWILGHRYLNNDKVCEQGRLRSTCLGFAALGPCCAPRFRSEAGVGVCAYRAVETHSVREANPRQFHSV